MKRVQDTSHAAHREARQRAKEIEGAVLESLRVHGPQTCTELADSTNRVIDNVRPTVTHLKDCGLVFKTKDRRPTQYGKPSIVWSLTPEPVIDADGQVQLFLPEGDPQ